MTPSGNSRVILSTELDPVSIVIISTENLYIHNQNNNNFTVITNLVTPLSAINPNVVGEYLVRYSFSDASGKSTDAIRSVVVQ